MHNGSQGKKRAAGAMTRASRQARERQELADFLRAQSERMLQEAQSAAARPLRLMQEHGITQADFAAYLEKIAGTDMERTFRAGMAALHKENEKFGAVLAETAARGAAGRPRRLRKWI